jgi:hypothetical protein
MTNRFVHEVVAETRTYELLRSIERHSSKSAFSEEELLALMDEHRLIDGRLLIDDLLAANILIGRSDGYGLSTLGIRTVLLLEAVNQGNVRSVFDRLANYDSTLRMYELVREGMTELFVDSLVQRPGFHRLYVCSPWISLSDRQQRSLLGALLRQEARGENPELLVITRPRQGTIDLAPPDVSPFRDLGAKVFLHPRLHTKLYIREPGVRGGTTMAIVGSQNLTQSRYLELGIRINSDTQLVGQLVQYFMNLTNSCAEAEREDNREPID